ncbi:MAG TPA: DUF5808 domain-containing protein [Pedobacter sp.]
MSDFEPSEDIGNYKWGIFYFNQNDPRIIVPKRIKFQGWTLNFAKHESYWIVIMIFVVTYLISKYRSQ